MEFPPARQIARRVWCLPKGHVEGGEDAAAAALREVQEETGYAGEILRPLRTIAYRFTRPGTSPGTRRGVPFQRDAPHQTGKGARAVSAQPRGRPSAEIVGTARRGHAATGRVVTVSKTVAFFLMQALRQAGSHDATEIVEARWMPLARASARLAYENERRVLRTAQRYLAQHDPPTWRASQRLASRRPSRRCRWA